MMYKEENRLWGFEEANVNYHYILTFVLLKVFFVFESYEAKEIQEFSKDNVFKLVLLPHYYVSDHVQTLASRICRFGVGTTL